MEIIKNHPSIGMKIECPKGKKEEIVNGIVTLVRKERGLVSERTESGFHIKTVDYIRYKVQPSDGGKAFWSPAVLVEPLEEKTE